MTMHIDNQAIEELIRKTRIVVAPETYGLVSLTEDEWKETLTDPSASPRMTVPFLIFRDSHEITMMLDETDLNALSSNRFLSKTERGFRLVTFDIELGFSVTGFIAAISRVLAEEQIPIVAVSSFSRDHLLIKQADLGRALLALGKIVDEVC